MTFEHPPTRLRKGRGWLLFDLGGVLCVHADGRGRHDWERRLGLRHGELGPLVFGSPMGKKCLLGQVSEHDVWRAIGEQFGLHDCELTDLQEQFWDGHRPDQQLFRFCEKIRHTVKLAVVSNFWSGARETVLRRLGVDLSRFDFIFFSCELGAVKRQRAFFARVTEAISVSPGDCVFVDDVRENVTAAEEHGMIGINHESTTGTLGQIRLQLATA